MSKARFNFCMAGICMFLPLVGIASEYDQYRLKDGREISGWLEAADGEKVLIRNKDGLYAFYPVSTLSDSAISKLEELHENKDIVHTSQHVESSTADPDRFLIPSYNQSEYGQNWGCVGNAAINFLLWWDRIGVIHIPEDGPEEKKVAWLHDVLYRDVDTYDGIGTTLSELLTGLKAYFETYPSDHYSFEYDIIPFGGNPQILENNVQGLNMTVMSMSLVGSSQRQTGHAITVLEASENHGLLLNTWGKTYMAELFEPAGMFNDSGYKQGTVWIVNFLSTCPPELNEGCWIVHKWDSLLIVRPVRRPDAPPKLVALQSGEDHIEQVSRLSGAGVFGKAQVLKYKIKYSDLLYGECPYKTGFVKVNGQRITDYIFAFAPSRIRYRIPKNVSTFTAIGTSIWENNHYLGSTGEWLYIVEIDGKEVFRSKPIKDYDNGIVPISVDIPEGSGWIEFVSYWHGRYGGAAVWALPEFK